VESPILPRPLPDTGGRFVRLVSPKVGNPVSGIIYSSHILGCNTHFVAGRTSPCLGADGGCIGHAEGTPVRWKGFLFGHSDQLHQPVIFELPADTVRQTLCLRDTGVILRGSHLRLTRVGPHANSTVRADVRLEVAPHHCPADEPDVLAWLCRIWGVADKRDEVYDTEGGRDAQ